MLSNYKMYSGGAKGSDIAWAAIGKGFGLKECNVYHFWHGQKTPYGNTELTAEEIEEGWLHVLAANETLKRKPEAFKSLLSRNWFQVKYADAIYAIGTIIPAVQVRGGTGWAVQMAIDNYKAVYVFDQNIQHWFRYIDNNFEACDTPMLTEQFAGIGTRDLYGVSVEAINDVYHKTTE